MPRFKLEFRTQFASCHQVMNSSSNWNCKLDPARFKIVIDQIH